MEKQVTVRNASEYYLDLVIRNEFGGLEGIKISKEQARELAVSILSIPENSSDYCSPKFDA